MPNSIKYFERAWLCSMALGLIVATLSFSSLTARGASTGFIFMIYIGVFAVMLTLMYFVSRKRSNIAKWIIVVLFVVGIVPYLPNLVKLFELGLPGFISTIQFVLQGLGIYFLFTEESRAWFKNKTSDETS